MASLLNHVWSGLDFWDKEENKKQRQQYAAQKAAPRPQVQQPQIQRPVSYAPQPLQQRVNQSYGSGISSITNRFRDLLDANTEADKIKRFAQSGLNETYNQQQDRLNQQSLNSPVHRSGVNQAVGNFLGGAAEITKLPAQMGNLASAVQQSHNPLIRGVVTAVNPSLGISSWLPKNKNQQKNIEAGQRMSQQAEQLISNKIQQSGLGERSTDNSWIAKPSRVGGQIGSQLAAAAATGGGSTVGAMIPTVQVASGSYDAARNAGFNNDKALGVAGLQGVLTGVTSKVGLGNIAGEFGAGRNILTNALQKTLIGGADMGAQQFASNVINKLTYNPNQNLMDGVKQAAVTGGIVSGIASPIGYTRVKPLNKDGYVQLPGGKDVDPLEALKQEAESVRKVKQKWEQKFRQQAEKLSPEETNKLRTKMMKDAQKELSGYRTEDLIDSDIKNARQNEIPDSTTSKKVKELLEKPVGKNDYDPNNVGYFLDLSSENIKDVTPLRGIEQYGDSMYVDTKAGLSEVKIQDWSDSGQGFRVSNGNGNEIARFNTNEEAVEFAKKALTIENEAKRQGKRVILSGSRVENRTQSQPPKATPAQAESATQLRGQQAVGSSTTRPLQNTEAVLGQQQKTGSQLLQDQKSIIKPSNFQERGFVQTILDDPNTAPEIKKSISSLYSVRNTKELQTKAANLVKDNPDMALRVARSGDGDISVATGSELIKKLQKDGNYEQAVDVATGLAEQLTKAGRTAQAASIYGRLTPEGVLRFAQKEINKYNDALGKKLQLSPEQAKSLTDKAAALAKMPEGREKDIATKQMLKDIYELMPATWTQKASTLQTMAQLLNFKTQIRNVVGNSMFSGVEGVSQTVAAGLDKIASLVTGKRTVALPQLRDQGRGLVRGFKEGVQESTQGINLGPATQFDLNEVPAFRGGFWGALEKTMNVSLRAPDRAAYTAAFDDTVAGLMKANKLKQPTAEILEQAHYNGLYRTFQDESKAAQLFVKLKGALNNVGWDRNGQKFGLGDFILKYPKTPANLLSRGIDYSPVGVLKGIIGLAKGDQNVGVSATARGLVGSAGFIGAGSVLGALGIITEKPESDTDLRNLQKKSGLGGYQINLSALKRFVLSGFNKDAAKLQDGDNLVSYDWAQPVAIPLSMGAAIGRKESAVKGAQQGIIGLTEGVNTLAEQPLVKGVQDFFGGYGSPIERLAKTAKEMPASFIPTLSSQINQLFDNTSRNTYDPNPLKESFNIVKSKIPGAAQTLPARVDSLGDPTQRYQNGSNNVFNVLFNPAFTSKYKPSQEAKLALDIYNSTGETKQAPRVMKTTQKINGENIKLTPKQNTDFQTYVGQSTKRFFNELQNDPRFNNLSDEEKANKMSSGLTDIVKAGKIAILGDKPDKAGRRAIKLASGGVLNYQDVSGGSRFTTPDSYKYDLQEYNRQVKNGELSQAQQIKAQKSLQYKNIYKDYSTKAQDLYSLSKTDLNNLVSSGKVDKKTIGELTALDQALVSAGLRKYGKFSSGKGGGGGGRKGGGGGGRKGSGTAKLASVLKASNAAIKPPAKPKSPGIKVKTSNVPTTFKKAPLKKYAVAKVTVGKSRR